MNHWKELIWRDKQAEAEENRQTDLIYRALQGRLTPTRSEIIRHLNKRRRKEGVHEWHERDQVHR